MLGLLAICSKQHAGSQAVYFRLMLRASGQETQQQRHERGALVPRSRWLSYCSAAMFVTCVAVICSC